MFASIRVVLVHTTHPGNIGGVARAMKNMGFSDLCLVSPKLFPSEQADARASGATDILVEATVVDSLEEAVADCQLVIGASARGRHIPWPVVDPRELAEAVIPKMDQLQVALVFGREDRGLTNEELQRCHRHVHIPASPEFSSLNLAAAVQVLLYELRMSALKRQEKSTPPLWGTDWDIELASAAELELMFEHLEKTLIDIEFLDPDNPRQLMPRLRRLFMRSHPDKVEVSVMRGMLTAMQKKLKAE